MRGVPANTRFRLQPPAAIWNGVPRIRSVSGADRAALWVRLVSPSSPACGGTTRCRVSACFALWHHGSARTR